MTTETTAPVKPAAPTVVQTIEKDYAWAKAHIIALLVTVLLLAGTAIGSVYGVESLIAKHDLKTEEKYNAQLAGEAANTKAAQATLVTALASFTEQLQSMQAANAKLQQTIANRNTRTQQQVKLDATLSAAQAAQRLSTQTSAPAGAVTAVGDDVTMSLPVTRNVVSMLDLLPATQANLADTQKEFENETILFNSSQAVVAAQAKTIDALTVQNAGQVKACAAEVKTVKDEARKSKMKWFFRGVVVGFIGGVFVGHGV